MSKNWSSDPLETVKAPIQRRAARIVGAVIIVWLAWALFDGISAVRDMQAGRQLLNGALVAGRSGDRPTAQSDLRAAEEAITSGGAHLRSSSLYPLRLLPYLGDCLRSAGIHAEIAREVTAVGVDYLDNVSLDALMPSNGRLPVNQMRKTELETEALSSELNRQLSRLSALDTPWPLLTAHSQMVSQISTLQTNIDDARRGLRLVQSIAGDDRPRRVLVLFENSAELRATGGLVGSWALIRAESGQLTLERVDRINSISAQAAKLPRSSPQSSGDYSEHMISRYRGRSTVQNLNMTPEFAVVGKTMLEVYNQLDFPPADVVIAINTPALAGLLDLSGPVDIDSSMRITSENVVDSVGLAAYSRFPNKDDRENFLADVVTSVWRQLLDGPTGDPQDGVVKLANAVRDRQVMVYSEDPIDQRDLVSLGAAGDWAPPGQLAIGWVTQNTAANKTDLFLSRSIDIEIELHREGDLIRYEMFVRMVLTNGAPSQGLPQYVLGPYVPGGALGPGDNRQLITLFGATGVDSLAIDGEEVALSTLRMGPWFAHTPGEVTIAQGTSSELQLRSSGVLPNAAPCMTMPIVPQPFDKADKISIRVKETHGPVLNRVTTDVTGPMIVAIPTEVEGCRGVDEG